MSETWQSLFRAAMSMPRAGMRSWTARGLFDALFAEFAGEGSAVHA